VSQVYSFLERIYLYWTPLARGIHKLSITYVNIYGWKRRTRRGMWKLVSPKGCRHWFVVILLECRYATGVADTLVHLGPCTA